MFPRLQLRADAPDPLPDLARLHDVGGSAAVIATHACAIHTGVLPLVVIAFPAAEEVTATATGALMRGMLADAVRIGRPRAEVDGDEPLCGHAQVDVLLDRVRPLTFGQPHLLLPGWGLTLWPAGHVLGDAMARLDTPQSTPLSVAMPRRRGSARSARQPGAPPVGGAGPGGHQRQPPA
jgi:predicted metal-dependent RNase